MNRRRFIATGLAATGAGMAARAETGWHVPGEERPHQATFMQWPSHPSVYPDPVFRRMTQNTILNIANTIAEFEPVILLAAAAHHAKIQPKLHRNVTLWDIPTEDLWARDAGPLFSVNGSSQRIMSLNFNGWGGKQVHGSDGQIAARVADRLGLPLVDSGVTGEPGGIEQDGHGLLIAHESSWANANRNTVPKAVIEDRLLAAYGADRMVWAPGLAGEDITDYHIDSLARFTGANRGIIQLPPAAADLWSDVMYETYDHLTAAGIALDIIPDPERPRIRSDDFVASYANYYVCNHAVICAEFGDRNADAEAQRILSSHYPGREIVALNVDPLGELGGGIHCATQQWPA